MDKDLEQHIKNARAVADSVLARLLWLNDQLILVEDEEAEHVCDEIKEALRAAGIMKLAVDAWQPMKPGTAARMCGVPQPNKRR